MEKSEKQSEIDISKFFDITRFNGILTNYKFIIINKLPTHATKSNYWEIIELYRDLAVENHLKKFYREIWIKTLVSDTKVKDQNPDFIKQNGKPLEYKTSLYFINPERFASIQKEWEEVYGKGSTVEILDDLLKIEGKWVKTDDTGAMRMINPLIREIVSMFGSEQPKSKNAIKIETSRTTFEELKKIVSTFVDIDNNKYSTDKLKQFAGSHGEALNKIAAEVVKNSKQAIEFIQKNLLVTSELETYIVPKNREYTTVKSDRPFDRDSNKVQNGEFMHGYKATALSYFLLDKKYEVVPQNAECIIPRLNKFYKLYNTLYMYSKATNETKSKLTQLKELNRILAFIKTGTHKEDIINISKTLKSKPTISGVENEIKKRINMISTEIQFEFGEEVRFKQGKMVGRLESDELEKLKINFNTRKNREESKLKDRTKMKNEVFVADYRNDIYKIFETCEEEEIKLIDVKNTYKSDVMNKIIDELEKQSSKYETPILTCKQSTAVLRYSNQLRSCLLNAARFEQKGHKGVEIVFTEDPSCNTYILSTPSPNTITSGVNVVMYYGKLNRLHIESCGHEYEYFEDVNNKGFYFIFSKPFRINLKHALASEEMLAGYLATAMHFRSMTTMDFDLSLLASLYLNFHRQLTYVLEIVYIIYKNCFNVASLGKEELKKKTDLSLINLTDIRACTILHRLKNGLRELVPKLQERLKQGLNFGGIEEPILKYKLSTFGSFQNIMYIKQLVPKDDGYDVVSLMHGFFKDEMDYHLEYMTSKFNKKVMPLNKPNLDKFFKELYTNDSNRDMVKLSYSPEAVYWAVRELARQAKEKGDGLVHWKEWNMPAVNTGKSSKVAVVDKIVNFVHMYIKDERKKMDKDKSSFVGKNINIDSINKKINEMIDKDEKDEYASINEETRAYKGIRTMDLTESLLYAHKLISILLKEGWFEQFGIKKTIIEDEQFSLYEMALYETLIYPKGTILLMQDKVQTGYGKRAFQMQLENSRNYNRVIDTLFKSILKSEESDIILIPGMEKNIKIQEMMSAMNTKLGDLLVTKDAAKFGDMFLIEAMILAILALRDEGIIDEDDKRIMLYWLEIQGNRLCLLFSEVAKAFRRFVEGRKYTMTDEEKRRVMQFSEEPYSILMDPAMQNWINDNLSKLNLFEDVRLNNMGFIKQVGGVLGVFNLLWSTLASCINLVNKYLWKHFTDNSVFKGVTHSDDAGDITKLAVPSEKQLQAGYMESKLTRGEITTKDIQDKRLRMREGKIYFSEIDDYGKQHLKLQHDETDVVKLYLGWTITISRMFSIRPSLPKWAIGYVFEILQQIHSADKEIHVPILRYASQIGKDDTAVSYAEALNSVGKVYDYALNGGTAVMIHSLLKILNWFTRYKFGNLKMTEDSKYDPPELGGIWYCLPGFIVEYGFMGNEMRLLHAADNNSRLAKILQITLNTDDFWKQKDEHKVKEDSKNEIGVRESIGSDQVLKSLTGEKVNSVDVAELDDTGIQELVKGSIETRKKFVIMFSRDQRTSRSRQKLIDLFATDLVQDANRKTKEDIDNEIREKVKSSLLYMQIPSGSFNRKFFSTINKYTSSGFILKYLRVPVETKIIQRLGYANRLFSNPFSNKVKIQFNIQENYLTFSEIVDRVHYIADNMQINKEDFSYKGYELNQKIYAELTQKIDNILAINPEIKPYTVMDTTEETAFNYKKYEVKRLFGVRPELILAAIAYLYENEIMLKPKEETSLVRYNPELFFDENFINIKSFMRAELQHLGLLNERLILRARLIANMFSIRPIESVIKTWDNYNRFSSLMEENFSIFLSLKLNMEVVVSEPKRKFELRELGTRIPAKIKVIGIVFLDVEEENNLKIISNNTPLHYEPIASIMKGLFSRRRTRQSYSSVIADMILCNKLRLGEVYAYRSHGFMTLSEFNSLMSKRLELINTDQEASKLKKIRIVKETMKSSKLTLKERGIIQEQEKSVVSRKGKEKVKYEEDELDKTEEVYEDRLSNMYTSLSEIGDWADESDSNSESSDEEDDEFEDINELIGLSDKDKLEYYIVTFEISNIFEFQVMGIKLLDKTIKFLVDIKTKYDKYNLFDNVFAALDFSTKVFMNKTFSNIRLENLQGFGGQVVSFTDKNNGNHIFKVREIQSEDFRNVLNIRVSTNNTFRYTNIVNKVILNSLITETGKIDEKVNVKCHSLGYGPEFYRRFSYKISPWYIEPFDVSFSVLIWKESGQQIVYTDVVRTKKVGAVSDLFYYHWADGIEPVKAKTEDIEAIINLVSSVAKIYNITQILKEINNENWLFKQSCIDKIQVELGLPLDILMKNINNLGSEIKGIDKIKDPFQIMKKICDKVKSIVNRKIEDIVEISEPSPIDSFILSIYLLEIDAIWKFRIRENEKINLTISIINCYFRMNSWKGIKVYIYTQWLSAYAKNDLNLETLEGEYNFLITLLRKKDMIDKEKELEFTESIGSLNRINAFLYFNSILSEEQTKGLPLIIENFDNIPVQLIPLLFEIRSEGESAVIIKDYIDKYRPPRVNYISLGVMFQIFNLFTVEVDYNNGELRISEKEKYLVNTLKNIGLTL